MALITSDFVSFRHQVSAGRGVLPPPIKLRGAGEIESAGNRGGGWPSKMRRASWLLPDRSQLPPPPQVSRREASLAALQESAALRQAGHIKAALTNAAAARCGRPFAAWQRAARAARRTRVFSARARALRRRRLSRQAWAAWRCWAVQVRRRYRFAVLKTSLQHLARCRPPGGHRAGRTGDPAKAAL